MSFASRTLKRAPYHEQHVRSLFAPLSLVFALSCACAVIGCNTPPNGQWPQPYDTDHLCTVSLDLTLVLDYSRSIWEKNPPGSWQNMLRFAQRFVSKFTGRNTRFAIITFNSNANLELGFTSDKQQALGKLQCMMNYGIANEWGTDIGRALQTANRQGTSPDRVAVFLVITDGHEEFYNGHWPSNQPSIMMQERSVAIQRGVHIATVQVGTDAVAKQELTALASTPDFYTALSDFTSFETSRSLENQIFSSVCLSVSGVLPTVITLEQSRHPDMKVDVAGTALCAASVRQYNAAFVSIDKPSGTVPSVFYSARPCEFDINAYRLHCSMPKDGLQANGRYRVELQSVATSEQTTNSLAILAVSNSPATATGAIVIPWPDPQANTTEILILGMTVLNFCVLMAILLLILLFLTWAIWFLRRPVDGRPRWQSYRESWRRKQDSWRQTFRSWRSRSPSSQPGQRQHHHSRASADLEAGGSSSKCYPPLYAHDHCSSAYSDSIMGLPPRPSAIPASATTSPKKLSVVYSPPPLVETEMAAVVCPASRSSSDENSDRDRAGDRRQHGQHGRHHVRSPTTGGSTNHAPPPRSSHQHGHHRHEQSRESRSPHRSSAHHEHHNSMPDATALAYALAANNAR